VSVEVSTALIIHLSDFCSTGSDAAPAIEALAALHQDLKRAVPSHLGLQLVLVRNGVPVTLTTFGPWVVYSDIATCLHLPLANDGVSAEPGSAVTFYAGTPGAFVDLAADFAYLHGRRHPAHPMSGFLGSGIRLDQDLRPTTVTSGLTGPGEHRTVNRAIGVLIDQGYEPDHAHAELARRAAVAGITALVCAAELLHSCTRGRESA
jgi:hypothetical protein